MEIPQYGIIRSLNVHVSGSILLWEYISLSLRSLLSLTVAHETEHVAVKWGYRRVCLTLNSHSRNRDDFELPSEKKEY